MIRRPPRSTRVRSSAASDVYKRQVVIILIALYAYYQQFDKGLVITGMRDYALWGVYISNFVFFVAISLVGSLVTAVLRLTNVHWSTPLTRIAEIIAVSAITFA